MQLTALGVCTLGHGKDSDVAPGYQRLSQDFSGQRFKEKAFAVVVVAGTDSIDGGMANFSRCPATDAGGTDWPLDGDDDGTATCDVGAFEAPNDAVFDDGFEV